MSTAPIGTPLRAATSILMAPFLGISVTARTTRATTSAAPPRSTPRRLVLAPWGGGSTGRGRIAVGSSRRGMAIASFGTAGTGGGGGGALGATPSAGGAADRAAPPELARRAAAAPTLAGLGGLEGI